MSCALQFLDVAEDFDLKSYYQNEYRGIHEYVPGTVMTPEERFLTMYNLMADRVVFFKDHVPAGGSVLEIGCSSGFFLGHLTDDYDVYGVEYNPEDAAYVREVGEIPCEEGDIEDVYPGKKFSAICAYAVLEHQPNPIEWLKKVKNRLVGGGHLIIEVPNSEEALLTLYNIPEYKDWWYREPHLVNFNFSNLVGAMGAAGFEARTHTRQKYSLMNHIHWMQYKKPMQSPIEAQDRPNPVEKGHPAASYYNRWWQRIDSEYRMGLEASKAGDTIVGHGRRIEI